MFARKQANGSRQRRSVDGKRGRQRSEDQRTPLGEWIDCQIRTIAVRCIPRTQPIVDEMRFATVRIATQHQARIGLGCLMVPLEPGLRSCAHDCLDHLLRGARLRDCESASRFEYRLLRPTGQSRLPHRNPDAYQRRYTPINANSVRQRTQRWIDTRLVSGWFPPTGLSGSLPVASMTKTRAFDFAIVTKDSYRVRIDSTRTDESQPNQRAIAHRRWLGYS